MARVLRTGIVGVAIVAMGLCQLAPLRAAHASGAHRQAEAAQKQRLVWQTNFRAGPQGWTSAAGSGWSMANGTLVNNGGDDGSAYLAPYSPGRLWSYAVEASIQFVRDYQVGLPNFGVIVNADNTNLGQDTGAIYTSAHSVSIWSDNQVADLAPAPYTVNHAWHTYRLAVSGKARRLLIDGKLVVSATDIAPTPGARIGLWSAHCQIIVRALKVFALG